MKVSHLNVPNTNSRISTLLIYIQRHTDLFVLRLFFCECFCTIRHQSVVIYLLTEIGLTPGGGSTVHVYTQTRHRTTQSCSPCLNESKSSYCA